MKLYPLIRPLLFKLDAETAHELTFSLGEKFANYSTTLRLIKHFYQQDIPELQVEAFNKTFANPIGIAAGFDKNGRIVQLISALGFGFMEVGSISALSCKGNPKPRIFRLAKDRALINRLGLNNDGAEVITERIKAKRYPSNFVLGINIVKTNDDAINDEKAYADFIASLKLAQTCADFIVLNVSCPNTADGKTFEEPKNLSHLLSALASVRDETPLLIKFSADLAPSELETLIKISLTANINGLVLTNTSQSRDNLKTTALELGNMGRGGLSGAPLKAQALEKIQLARKLVGNKIPIIGVGGIETAHDAFEYFQAGATLIEAYTGLVYQGPGYAKNLKRDLLRIIQHNGYRSLQEFIDSK